MSEPMSERERWQLELDKLQRGLQGDPFAFLGPQRDPGGEGGVLRAYLPGAQRVRAARRRRRDARRTGAERPRQQLVPAPPGAPATALPPARALAGRRAGKRRPYAFGPLLGELDLYLFAEGNHRQLASCLGAQLTRHEGVEACASRSGRRTPCASRWSAISTAGTGAVTRCDDAIHPASGNCSSRASARRTVRSTSCRATTASCR